MRDNGVAPELASAVQTWRLPIAALIALGQDCDDADFALPTECPGWTVKDQLSHVIGVERSQLGEPDPDLAVPALPHIRNDLGRRTEVAVQRRRAVPGPKVVAELEEVLARRTQQLLDGAHRPNQPTATPIGVDMPLVRALALRTFDCWSHEQDVRRALGRPGNLDSEAAQVAIGWMHRMLPTVVARGARVPAGHAVVLRVDGPVSFGTAVRVELTDDGRPRGVAVDVEMPDAEPIVASADATVSLSTEAYSRRCCGRWTAADTPALVTGDRTLARAVLEALAITP